MNKYLIQVRIKGQLVKTTIQADSVIHAKLLAEWHFGIGSVTNTPVRLGENTISKPLTPQQQRIKSLQTQKQNIAKQLKAERNRQKIQRAQQTIQSVISK